MTLRQHLRKVHGYDRIPRGADPERVHAMTHKAEARRGAEDHDVTQVEEEGNR